MANQEHLDLLQQGVKQWNEWRCVHLDVQPDFSEAVLRYAILHEANLSGTDLRRATLSEAILSQADLSGANLSGAGLRFTTLTGANLNGANLSGAYLMGADLNGANLSGAYLMGADLSGASLNKVDFEGTDLSRASLSGADLGGANLSGANLRKSDFSNVHLWKTVFADNDLRATQGLLEISHDGPSRVELYTVKLPQDGSALHFLRGAGVPDEWIDIHRAHMMHPIQYHSCFISYSSKDDVLAHRLHADLQGQGVRCWFAPEDMKIGDKIRPRIDEAIHLQDKLLLLLSEYAIVSSWVEDEVEAAMEKEQRQQREVLFPVRLDESVMQTIQAWAAKLRRTRHIGDFTNWTNPQAYQIAFDRLLRDLKRIS